MSAIAKRGCVAVPLSATWHELNSSRCEDWPSQSSTLLPDFILSLMKYSTPTATAMKIPSSYVMFELADHLPNDFPTAD